MKVDMDRSPMPVVVALLRCVRTGGGAGSLHQEQKLGIPCTQDSHTGEGFGGFVKSKCLTIEAKSFFQAGNVDANRKRDHAILRRLTKILRGWRPPSKRGGAQSSPAFAAPQSLLSRSLQAMVMS